MRQENNTNLFIDIFAGCGGLSLGLIRAGWKCAFAIEKNCDAFSTYKHNLLDGKYATSFDWPIWLERTAHDIDELLESHRKDLLALRGKVELIAGGPPCQGFSSAGRRQHDDPRNKLFESYLKVVDIIHPNAILIENVRGFTSDFSKTSSVRNYSAELVERLSTNYDVHFQLCDLSEFGVPQSRVRFFLIALRKGIRTDDPFDVVNAKLPTFLRKNNLRVPVTAKQALSSLEVTRGGCRPSGETSGFMEICPTSPATSYQKYLAQEDTAIHDLRLARQSGPFWCAVTERAAQHLLDQGASSTNPGWRLPPSRSA